MNKLKQEEKSFKGVERRKSPSISKKRSKSKFYQKDQSPIRCEGQK